MVGDGHCAGRLNLAQPVVRRTDGGDDEGAGWRVRVHVQIRRTVVEGEEGADDDGDGGVVEEVEEGHLFFFIHVRWWVVG